MDAASDWRRLLGEVDSPPPVLDWDELEARMGTGLPPDYRVFVDLYPAVSIDHFMTIHHPGAPDVEMNLVAYGRKVIDFFMDMRSASPKAVPYPLFPESGGLLFWGVTDNGDHFFWITDGAPERWKIAVTGGHEWWEYGSGMLDFLKELLNHEIECPILSGEFPEVGYEVEACQFG